MDVSKDGLVSRPHSIKELSEKATEFQWNPIIPFKFWVRAAESIYREAVNYERESNYAQAYTFYLRHSILVLDRLSKHPEIKAQESKLAIRPLLKRMPDVLKDLERLKPRIESSYQQWLKAKASQTDTADSQERLSQYHAHAANDPALSWNTISRPRVLDAREHQDVALTLAKQEIRRRDAARRTTRQTGITDEEEKRRRGARLWDSWDVPAENNTEHAPFAEDQDMRGYMEETRRLATSGGDIYTGDTERSSRPSYQPLGPRQPPSQSYHYPSISKSTPVRFERDSLASIMRDGSTAPPPRPLKEALLPSPPPYRSVSPSPALPQKEALPPWYDTLTPESAPELPPKVTDVAFSPKKERTVFQPAAYLENGEPLRTVFLPANLRKTFLEIASDNTKRGLEMCGILCGTPVNNALFVSCLLIPEQKCTSDTCETENESSMLEFCIAQDLLVLGWIHTHPTQTCFMSSRDLHTQAGYQVMMPEALAIVCAPKHTPSHGIFRLTHPPGLGHILECTHTATFHQHSIDNIYTGADNPPGHVIEHRDMDFTVQDLRPKR